MIYQEVKKLSEVEADRMLRSESGHDVVEALLSLAFFEGDWKVAQNACVGFLDHSDPKVARAAAIGIGHIA